MRRLLPDPRDEVSDDDLIAAYAYPSRPGKTPWVRANMVGTLDGAAVGPDGRTGTIASPGDRRLFALLRSLSDVILVGAATTRVEHYGPATRYEAQQQHRETRGQAAAPAIAVVSRSLDLDPADRLFSEATARTIVLTTSESPRDRRRALSRVADLIVVGEQSVELAAAVDALAARGQLRILCEGGPLLLRELVEAHLLDELCLTISPLLRGGGAPTVLAAPPLTLPWEAHLQGLHEEDATLFGRWTARLQDAQ